MHKVICRYCGETFDRDKEPFVKISHLRYAHEKCHKKYAIKKTQDEKDLEELERYIKKFFNEPYINAQVRKQIKDFRQEYGYTYSGILKTLIYWYDIKGNPRDREITNGGIGIVPFVYEQSKQYYYSLYLAQLANQGKDIEKFRPKVREVKIQPPQRVKKEEKLFNLGDD